MSYLRNSTIKSEGGWRDKLEYIRAAFKEYGEYSPLMTLYERTLLTNEIKNRRTQYEPEIVASAIGEWDATCDKVLAAEAKIEKARGKESARWEAGRLASEMQLHNMLIETALASDKPLDQLRAVYEDAQRSGDIYKQRAAAEVFSALDRKLKSVDDFDTRGFGHVLAEQAKRDAAAIRTTPELEQAHQDAQTAYQELQAARAMLADVDAGLGYQLPNGGIGNTTLFVAIDRRIERDHGEWFVKPLQSSEE